MQRTISLSVDATAREYSDTRFVCYVGGHHMDPTSTDQRPLNFSWISIKPVAFEGGESQFPFALLFMSIQALSEK